ncbi:uncharacterized protein EV420DRAFT_1489995 [Desarmillaria tabescens]|uniref:Uncharacterized protein n=1 Tax=Armillaria tabescens TaxID=1929756 RepID=A0AA39MG82_ARMTA|nr:uncharacterized protein EV420DRAFT_1489995 [Desarmillaria tabescens]KAK0432350.1 hypothetical protein EV420DRAFT_1489995 [Desarmillaria tabescens]
MGDEPAAAHIGGQELGGRRAMMLIAVEYRGRVMGGNGCHGLIPRHRKWWCRLGDGRTVSGGVVNGVGSGEIVSDDGALLVGAPTMCVGGIWCTGEGSMYWREVVMKIALMLWRMTDIAATGSILPETLHGIARVIDVGSVENVWWIRIIQSIEQGSCWSARIEEGSGDNVHLHVLCRPDPFKLPVAPRAQDSVDISPIPGHPPRKPSNEAAHPASDAEHPKDQEADMAIGNGSSPSGTTTTVTTIYAGKREHAWADVREGVAKIGIPMTNDHPNCDIFFGCGLTVNTHDGRPQNDSPIATDTPAAADLIQNQHGGLPPAPSPL